MQLRHRGILVTNGAADVAWRRDGWFRIELLDRPRPQQQL
jgi:hypothetical protein